VHYCLLNNTEYFQLFEEDSNPNEASFSQDPVDGNNEIHKDDSEDEVDIFFNSSNLKSNV
jgi:hypothetical protein